MMTATHRPYRPGAGARLTLAFVLSFAALTSAQEAAIFSPETIRERYEFESWSGRTGPSWVGPDRAAIEWDGWKHSRSPYVAPRTVIEHGENGRSESLGLSLERHHTLVGPDRDPQRHSLRVELGVTKSPREAHVLLLNHFLTPRSAVPADPPALPWGGTRIERLGDVAFGPTEPRRMTRIVFVRGNIFVRVDAVGDAAPVALDYCRHLDRQILRSERADRYDSLSLPTPVRFELTTEPVGLGQPIGFELEVAPGHIAKWILPHGDLVRDLHHPGDTGYIPRRPGPIRVMLIDPDGRFAVHDLAVPLE